MTDTGEEIEEILVNPLSKIMREIGSSVAETQRALDRNSIRTQIELESDEGLSEYDLQASWYHIPEVEFELKLSLTIKLEEERDLKGRLRGFKPILNAAPLNASHNTLYNYNVQGSSCIKARIVSIPASAKLREE
ncbi:MAG: hypothetical protein PHV51_00255 [Methanosarcinaceae archaeon]|nr:hypothetical protein [Methanosarcinaceae archaeon]MDD4496579.1 hypothetical protein [Methanosarcinaceae archaeon]